MRFDIRANLDQSVVRRSLVLLCFVIPGFLLNYGLIVGANHMLTLESFGVFYTSLSIINVLFAPAIILSLFFTRHFATIFGVDGTAAVLGAYRALLRRFFKWGVPTALVVLLVLFFALQFVAPASYQLLLAIIVATYFCYLAETLRALLQGVQRFTWLGVYSLTWMSLRFVFAMAGLYIFERVWTGIGGIGFSAIATFILFYWRLFARTTPTHENLSAIGTLSAKRLVLFTGSYSLFVAISFADVILAYFLFDKAALGEYSASSILPKAVIVIIMPICQVFFSNLVKNYTEAGIDKGDVLKGVLLTAVLAGGAALVLWLLRTPICAGQLGIKSCHPGLLTTLALAAIPVSFLRIAVLVQLVRGRDWHPLILVAPVLTFLVFVEWTAPLSLEVFADHFHVFAWLTLLFYVTAGVADRRSGNMTCR